MRDRRSDRKTMPLDSTTSAFSLSTSTTARRAGTTARGAIGHVEDEGAAHAGQCSAPRSASGLAAGRGPRASTTRITRV